MQPNSQISRRLRLRDLHYLLTVVQTGSMAKAATLLSVSQPVISKVIADMEHALGARMLDRSPRGVEPTIYGRQLLASSFAIFDELRHGVIEVEHMLDNAGGELSIGSNEASTLGIVPSAINELRRRHPRVFVQVVLVNTPAEQRQELLRRTIEMSIGRIWRDAPDPQIESEILFDEQFVVVVGPHNPWKQRGRVELSELVDRPWILPPIQNLSGQLVADIFRRKGLEAPASRVRTSSIQLTQRLLEAGSFLTMLPTSVLPALTACSDLRALPVPLPDLAAPIGIMKLKGRKLSPVAQIFIDAAHAAARAIPVSEPGSIAYSPTLPVSSLNRF